MFEIIVEGWLKSIAASQPLFFTASARAEGSFAGIFTMASGANVSIVLAISCPLFFAINTESF